MLTLYTYFRSSAAYRARIGLALKGLAYESVPVHLVRDGGEQHSAQFFEVNPAKLVPVLIDGDLKVTQSLAILEYLDETYRATPLLPSDRAGRARVRSIALSIACDIHPLNNTRVLKHLEYELGIDTTARTHWYQHWVTTGLAALERELAQSASTGTFCHGDTPTIADCCLVPQVYNARRFNVRLAEYPTVVRINERCLELPAFVAASPEQQADAA